jgi:hypothetical protein
MMRSTTPSIPSQSNVFIGMLALATVYFSGTLGAKDVQINAKDCKHLYLFALLWFMAEIATRSLPPGCMHV